MKVINMTKTLNTLLRFTALCLSISACGNTAKANDVAAILSEPSTQDLQLINQQVAKLLGLSTVILSKDVFKSSSWLILDAPQHKDPQGNLVMGNNASRPDKVQLVINNEQCLLVHPSTGKSTILINVHCKPLRLPIEISK